MSVDSYLELFTTLFGWAFYGVLWNVMVDTGIVFLPFLGIIVDNWKESAERGDDDEAVSQSQKRMEIELLSALFVVVLAGQPSALTTLDAGTLRYSPPPTLAEPSPESATVNNSQSTFGDLGFVGSPDTVNLPIWWYAVVSLSSGLNHAVVEGLPAAADLRAYEQQARLATIAEPGLRAEVSQFFSDCFVPARSRYQQESSANPQSLAIISDHGVDDPDWLGSHIYREINGFYDRYRASQPTPGWEFQPSRDTEYDPAAPPEWGRPMCDQWWADELVGVRQKLLQQADLTAGGLAGLVVAIAPSLATELQQDAIAKAVLANAPTSWSNNELAGLNVSNIGLLGTAERWLKGGMAAGGVAIASALMSVTITAILMGLPMLQAVLLLAIYALLPMLILLSRYSLKVLMTGALAIFTVKFWSVLWYLALWVDQNLIQSMYPDINTFLQIFANPGEHDSKRLLLNMVTTSLYLGLPLLWSAIMSWAGIHLGRSLSIAASPLARPMENSGRHGGQIGKAMIGGATRR